MRHRKEEGPSRKMSPTIINYAEDYFHTLSPLAKRIVEEICHTREAYEALWDGLSVPEQRQILDEAIIKPEAILKYSRSAASKVTEVEVYPCIRIQTGSKFVHYDDGSNGKGVKWRDEHSAPFSWLTRSQQDLRIFGSNDPQPTPTHKKSKSSTPVRKSKAPAPPVCPENHMDPPSLVLGGSSAQLIEEDENLSPSKKTILNRLISKTGVFKLPFPSKLNGNNDTEEVENENLLTPRQVSAKIVKPSVLKPKLPPPPPPKRKETSPDDDGQTSLEALSPEDAVTTEDEFSDARSDWKVETDGDTPLLTPASPALGDFDAASAGIPKTGLDFLDNW
ncbi:Hypothetical predicted protein [Cloeon dipterum]|uniref:DUF4706 domain-containing protein n=1 Tax=Cloeon dipterum TaxID=197152 RepID=A0A8S1CJ40_9INSE|nr:Hypothetical predicted protein [Cloeon dipterum]